MKFGRKDDLAGMDLTLPCDPHATLLTLERVNQAKGVRRIYVGCPVWADKGFVGTIYPAKTRPADYLFHYCRQFNAIEVNATYYQTPSPPAIRRWASAAVPGFRFCMKIPQTISHRRDIDKKSNAADRFLEAAFGLGEFLGMSFLQLPPHFGPGRAGELQRFLDGLPGDFRIAVEFRHPLWFSDAKVVDAWSRMLAERNIPAVMTDVAGRRDVLHMRLTADTAFIRFTGNNLHPSDYLRADAWVDRITQWLNSGLKSVYFFVHEPEKRLCADLALYFIGELNAAAGLSLQPPAISGSKQKELFV